MTEIATIDWFGRWGTSVFSENSAIFKLIFAHNCLLQIEQVRTFISEFLSSNLIFRSFSDSLCKSGEVFDMSLLYCVALVCI